MGLSMGMSKVELWLRRLLAAQVHQTNYVKLVHYVSTMQDLLSTLTGDAAHQDLHPSLLQILKSMLGRLSLWLTTQGQSAGA
jgi:hypothetical protein